MTPEREVTPAVLERGDPTSGDEALYVPGDHANYVRFYRGPHDAREYARVDRHFHEVKLAWTAGRAPWSTLAEAASAVGVDHEVGHDRRPLLDAGVRLPDDVLADVVEDQVTDAALLVERVTGDPFVRTTAGILAALAYVPYMLADRRPVDAWADEETRDRPLVIAARAIDRAPPSVWVDGRSLLPLPERFLPPDGPPGVWVARSYVVGGAWAWSGAVALPAAPDASALRRRVLAELWDLRRLERRSTWEDALRRRPTVVYRAAAEGARRALVG